MLEKAFRFLQCDGSRWQAASAGCKLSRWRSPDCYVCDYEATATDDVAIGELWQDTLCGTRRKSTRDSCFVKATIRRMIRSCHPTALCDDCGLRSTC